MLNGVLSGEKQDWQDKSCGSASRVSLRPVTTAERDRRARTVTTCRSFRLGSMLLDGEDSREEEKFSARFVEHVVANMVSVIERSLVVAAAELRLGIRLY